MRSTDLSKHAKSMRLPPTIGICDNDELTLGVLARYLQRRLNRFHIIWAVTQGRLAINKCLHADSKPDILLTDMSLTDIPGTDVIHQIRLRQDHTRILALTSFTLDTYTHDAALAGAQGIVAKRSLPLIAQAIITIKEGKVWAGSQALDPQSKTTSTRAENTSHTTAVNLFLSAPASRSRLINNQQKSCSPLLSSQEQAVLSLFTQGLTTQEAANKLDLGEGTVKTYTARIFKKLGAHNRNQAITIWLNHQK